MKHSAIKYCKSFLQNIRNFSLSYTLKDKVYRLEHEINELSKNLEKLEKRKRIVELKNENLTKIESYLKNTKNINQSDLEEFLKEELTRLHKILEDHMGSIEKSTLSKSNLINIELPTFIPSSNPFGFLKNYLKYRKELKDYKDSIQNNEKEEFIFSIEKDNDGFYVDKENHSSYKAEYFKETNRHLEVGGKLKRIYYLADIPAYLSPYVFFRLLTSSLPFRLSTFVEPASSGELLKKARQRLSVLEMQQNERIKIGKIRDQQIDKNIDEVMSFIDELVHEAEKGIVYSLYLQLEADTEEELTTLHKQLQNISESMDLTFNQYTFGHKQAFKNFMPFVQDHLKENRILQSTAVSYLMPFVSKQLSDPDGIFLGVNAYNDSLVFIDPFTSRNNNINILGVSGSGKSVTAKVLMNRLYMRGVQIIAIDPEGEYTELAKKLGGEVIQFSRENGINPFYINSSKENDILDHISTLKTFFKFFIPDNHYDSAFLDEKLTKLYDSRTPDFENFLALLGDNQMAKDLSILSTGSLRGIFNSKRKLELDNDVIILDLHDLKKDEKRDPAMYLLTSLIWNLINKNTNSKRMLFIDEAHKLLVDKEVAIFYRELVKQARKRNVGIVSITQDVEDFLDNEYGKAIVTNSETKILLKQSYATLSQIGTIYPMTDEEKQQLGHLGIGEIVLFRENEHIRLNIVVLPFEKPLTFTN
jgi:DNA replication protein DnaC